MGEIARLPLQADATGTLELVCERASDGDTEPALRTFGGDGEFGLLVDDLRPNEAVTLYFEYDGENVPAVEVG